MAKSKWLAVSVAVALVWGYAGVSRSEPATTSAPMYYQEALRAYWSGSNSIAFVLASLAVENDADPKHIEHAGYLATVLASEKLTAAELEKVVRDDRIAPLMLDIYARGLRAARTNDNVLAFRVFRDFTLSTPSERWQRIGLAASVLPNWGVDSPGECEQNLCLAELALKLAPDPTTAGRIAEVATGHGTTAQKTRAAAVMAGVYERTDDMSWAEKAFSRWLDTQQFAPAETLAQRILTNASATVSTYVSVGTAYCRAGRLPRAEEVLDTAVRRFGNSYAELALARAELYRCQHRYEEALNGLLTASREVAQFRLKHYHPVWAKQLEAVALATGPNDSVYAVTGETKPRVLHLDRGGEVLAQYGPFDDPTDDGAHPFAVFNDGTFLIRNRRWSSDGRMLQEFPFSPSARAVCVDRGQRVLAFDSTQGITILSADAKVITNLCRGGPGWTPCYNLCPCFSIAANEESIVLVTRNGPMRLNYKGGYSGPWYGGGFHDVAAGRDNLFCLSGVDQVRVTRLAPSYALQPLESIPCGGAAIAAATSGGFYVAGVTTERGTWLVKFAPPFQPAE